MSDVSAQLKHRLLQLLVVLGTPAIALLLTSASVHAQPDVLVHPGMEIHQDSVLCTLGYVDPATRVAFTAGHCRASGTVTDKHGTMIGTQGSFRDNTPNGMTVDTNHQITDWQVIHLTSDVMINNVLPGGQVLVTDPAVLPVAGMPVCHFGVVTKESCGIIEAVNNGWFTMTDGVVSKKGDSGGPVYTNTPDGRTVLIGIFNSTWGVLPAAVSWQVARQQAREDTISAASASLAEPPALP
ncbi:MAG: S1 family peptidase [Actinomycetia bacterium]|nr:S1 family peptidase [Actinomycetes bacterium]MCH9700649.1 S1 family peptidase [Actinomycetes bacterium]MCH9761927.1 S1 family peptidase [Actinomycetes bacterium]